MVAEWFVRKFGTPTEPQEQGWPHILAGRTTLISAPTGSGKTLAAFLACIDRLVRKALAGELRDRIEVLYVSPLKALGNDIQKNLEGPLAEIMALAAGRGLLMPPVRTAVRTGDTLPADRRAMLRRPPQILVTTPESLYILLTAGKSRETLRSVQTVIVDEIHAVADDKRGAHLALSLERLTALTGAPPVRIGLSATQKPIELIAEFLVGEPAAEAAAPHNLCQQPVIVQVGHKRALDLAVEVPKTELGAVASSEMWDEVYERMLELIAQHRSTLIFVNTRRLAERIAAALEAKLGEGSVPCHHGSMSRKLRLEAERKLKNGEVRALVATASLELGIDVGYIDLVCHIGSPRSIAVMLQRVGRAGHWRGGLPKARMFVTTRDELIECAALVRAMRRGELDRILIPDAPLDVLAQQLVAMCASDEWLEDDLFALIRRAHPYRELSRERFDRILDMLSEGIAAQRGRYGAYLFRDRVHHRLRARRGARAIAIMNGGAIPETGLFNVVNEEGQVLGSLDEDFSIDSSRGDVIQLGNTTWRVERIDVRHAKVVVSDAHGAAPTLPFWRGEAPGRTHELSHEVAAIREHVSGITPNVPAQFVQAAHQEVARAAEWLGRECGLCSFGALQAISYVVEGRAVLGTVPTQTTLVAERFFDEGGGMQLIIHAPFGARIHKAWGLALRKRFCVSFNFELQAAATDNGLNICLAEQHSFPLIDVFQFLQPESLHHVLEQAVLDSPIFQTRWRWDANRALALLRFQRGKKVPPHIQRLRSDDLLASVFPDAAACFENIQGERQIPDHPLIGEVMHDVLNEAMDISGLAEVLNGIRDGAIRCHAVDTPVPSQFAHEILNANPYAFLDDAGLEERRARAVELRRTLPEAVLNEIGRLDPCAIREVCAQAWMEPRDTDELHDALHTLVALPEDLSGFGSDEPHALWGHLFEGLVNDGRAARFSAGDKKLWVIAEHAHAARALWPDGRFEGAVAELGEPVSAQDACYKLVQGWLQHTGPVTARRLAECLGLPRMQVFAALLRYETSGAILRGVYEDAAPSDDFDIEWCERRLLQRIHRLTISALRREVEPVTPQQFMRWLFEWQHVASNSQLMGERGLLRAIQQLQGFELAANAWERDILACRVAHYSPKLLDQLCLTGSAGWGRLSPHPATLEAPPDGEARVRRIVPTSVAPITFFVREDADWMVPRRPEDEQANLRALSPDACMVYDFLRTRGASFFADIVRCTEKPKAEIETALWELVAAGLITADSFDNLRALIGVRGGANGKRAVRPRSTAGRWCLLHPAHAAAHNKAVEALCRVLLARYGVVFRGLLERENIPFAWREMLYAFRRMEDRGQVRGGRFVSGFSGEQFALPEAVEALRASRKRPTSTDAITISACDPLNLAGIIVPGERVPAVSGRAVTFCDGAVLAQQ